MIMKNLLRTIVITTAIIFSTSAFAELKWREKPVQCGSPESLYEIIDSANEKPILGGISQILTSQLATEYWPVYIFVNTETGTFTIVEIHLNTDEACVVSFGNGIDFDVQKYFEKKEQS